MTRDEWNQWHDHLSHRLPEIAAYIQSLPAATRDVWFADIFSHFELRDAIAVTLTAMDTGDAPNKFERDRLPGYFKRRLQKQQHERERREELHRSSVGAQRAVSDDPEMGPALRWVCARQREYHEEHNVTSTPDWQRHMWVEQWYQENT